MRLKGKGTVKYESDINQVTRLCLQPRAVGNLLVSSCLLLIYHLFMATLNPYHNKHVLEK